MLPAEIRLENTRFRNRCHIFYLAPFVGAYIYLVMVSFQFVSHQNDINAAASFGVCFSFKEHVRSFRANNS